MDGTAGKKIVTMFIYTPEIYWNVFVEIRYYVLLLK